MAGGFAVVEVGPATPRRSPTGNGLRSIPTIGRVESAVLVAPGGASDYSRGLYEDWLSSNYLRKREWQEPIAYFDPHFAVFLPSRFYWPGRQAALPGAARSASDETAQVGRSIDLCYAVDGQRRARGGECDRVPDDLPRVAWDDRRSPFDGVKREFYFNQTRLANARGPSTR